MEKGVVLLIIDVINPMDFPGGDKLARQAWPAAKNILRLKRRFQKARLPVVYVNDNFGRWRSHWEEVYRECASPGNPGARVSELLRPDPDDYFVLKPKHSGFHSSNLDTLLQELKAKELVLTGFAGNICVLFTANDAYMRGYGIHVPKNCIASNRRSDNDYVLRQLKDVFKIKTSAVR